MDIVKPVSMGIHQGIGKSGFTDHIEVIFSALTGKGGYKCIVKLLCVGLAETRSAAGAVGLKA